MACQFFIHNLALIISSLYFQSAILLLFCFSIFLTAILLAQVVFRLDPRKYRKLRGELNDFSVLVKSLMLLLSNIEGTDSVQIIQQVCDWQV